MSRKRLEVAVDSGPKPVGPYASAVIWGDLVFVSGQAPIDPRTGRSVAGDFRAQLTQVLENLDATLNAARSNRSCVLKVQVYLTDVGDFDVLNELYADFFHDCELPSRTTIEAAAIPGKCLVEVDAIAHLVDEVQERES